MKRVWRFDLSKVRHNPAISDPGIIDVVCEGRVQAAKLLAAELWVHLLDRRVVIDVTAEYAEMACNDSELVAAANIGVYRLEDVIEDQMQTKTAPVAAGAAL